MTSDDGVYTRVLGLSIRRDEEGLPVSLSASGSGHPGVRATTTTTSTIQQIRVTLTYPTATNSSASTTSGRHLLLRLTSDADPVFFYHLRLGELDYPTLKQNQGLLVDFTGFPAQLMSLLDKCGDDKFQLVMRSGRDMSILDIVESNPFKYLAHLSLFVVPGTDCDVKRYLAQVTIDLKRENEGIRTQLQHMYSSLQAELVKNKVELDRKDFELNQLREEIRNETAATSERYFRDISSEKEKFIKFQTDLTTKFEVEKVELERRHRENILTLESKFTSVDNDKRQFEQEAFRTNSKLKDYETRMKSNEEDMRMLNQELQMLRKNNHKLDADYHEKQHAVAHLSNKLSVSENEVKEKCGTIARQQDLITTLGEKIRVLEEKSRNLGRELDQSKETLRQVSGDMNKANDIIRKLQDDCRQSGKKVKMQAHLLVSQETQLTEKTTKLADLTASHKSMTSQNESLGTELTDAKQKIQELKEKVESQRESLESKQDMIDWLNKQLNEFQGLSNLSKFRQNLNESSNSKLAGSGDAPSWMNIYNSTGTATNGASGLAALSRNNNSTLPQSTNVPTTGVPAEDSLLQGLSKSNTLKKQPTWANSSKVTLGAVNRSTHPIWKK